MQITLAGEDRELATTELEAVESVFTGRQLRRYEITFHVGGDALADQVDDQLRAAQDRDNPGLAAADGSTWRVQTYSRSWGDNSRVRFSVQLLELEQLDLERIEFLGFDLIPEEVQLFDVAAEEDGILTATVLVTLDEAESARFVDQYVDRRRTNERQFFDVSLHGIRDDVRRGRFGRVLWEPRDDGARRWCITIVWLISEAELNAGKQYFPRSALEPHYTNLLRRTAVTKVRVDRLVDELLSAGVLDAAAVDRIRAEVDQDELTRIGLELAESEDVAKYL